jgi:predicted MFS family arabinose efflux permease
MLAAIGIGTWFGYWLDGWLRNEVPIFTLVFSMLALGAVIAWLLKISKSN